MLAIIVVMASSDGGTEDLRLVLNAVPLEVVVIAAIMYVRLAFDRNQADLRSGCYPSQFCFEPGVHQTCAAD